LRLPDKYIFNSASNDGLFHSGAKPIRMIVKEIGEVAEELECFAGTSKKHQKSFIFELTASFKRSTHGKPNLTVNHLIRGYRAGDMTAVCGSRRHCPGLPARRDSETNFSC
jgi:hypothetical protein